MGTSQRTEVLIELEARAGAWDIGEGYRPLRGMMYNGRVPGPAIRARVGDTLVVRLANHLREATAFECGGSVPLDGGLSHCPVEPGAIEERRFLLPAAGTFRYGPLTNDAQMEQGLYGMLIVRRAAERAPADERTLVFDDVCLERHGRIATRDRRAAAQNRREGSVLLLDGRVQPMLTMAPGMVERWRLLNAATVRRVCFSLGGAAFRIIDPARGLPAATATDVLLVPGEGGLIEVGPFESGEIMHVQALSRDRNATRSRLPAVFGTIHVGRAG